MFCLIALLSIIGAQAAEPSPEHCPDFSGSYQDRGPFIYRIQQQGCASLSWETRDAPNSPNPPSEPSIDTFTIDCQKKGGFLRKESVCWNGPVLEQRAYTRNSSGHYVPITIRRLSLTEGKDIADRVFLTDETGEEKLFQDSLHERLP